MPASSCRWFRRNIFSRIRLMKCVISSNSVNIVRLLKCVIPCSPDANNGLYRGGRMD